jgi:iduronate 2-sulfatase
MNWHPMLLTLNQHFENNGYQVWASGKIYHHGIDHKLQFGENYFNPETNEKGRGYLSEESWKIVEETEKWYRENRGEGAGGRGPAYEWANVPDNAYSDGKMTDLAVEKMADYKNGEQPFFMAVGFHKPHLPFNAPKKYWDLYDVNEIEMAGILSNLKMQANTSITILANCAIIRESREVTKCWAIQFPEF